MDKSLVWESRSDGTLGNMKQIVAVRGGVGQQGPQGPQGPQGDTGGGSSTFYPPFGPIIPTSFTASSSAANSSSNVNNLGDPGDDFWLSALDSTNPEFVTLDFSWAHLPTAVTLWFSDGRSGNNVRVEGSNNNSTWTTLLLVDPTIATLVGSIRVYSAPLPINTTLYRYIRIYSDPSPYMHYHYIQIFGATILD